MKDLKTALSEKQLFFIAGPCVIEDENICLTIAEALKKIADDLSVPIFFKSSYKKANRTSPFSYRGPGLEKGLAILREVKSRTGLPVLTDVHETYEVEKVAQVADIIQIPAFLCRQTELIECAAKTGRWVNIKKGQFMAPEDMKHAAEKVTQCRNDKVLITERGTTFGYHNLVVDFRSIPILKSLGLPVIFDGTHSVQLPGGAAGASSGQRQFVIPLSRSACAAGVDGFFFEVHPDPDKALSDAANSLDLQTLQTLIRGLLAIKKAILDLDA